MIQNDTEYCGLVKALCLLRTEDKAGEGKTPTALICHCWNYVAGALLGTCQASTGQVSNPGREPRGLGGFGLGGLGLGGLGLGGFGASSSAGMRAVMHRLFRYPWEQLEATLIDWAEVLASIADAAHQSF